MKMNRITHRCFSLMLLAALLASLAVPACCAPNAVAISFGQVNGRPGEQVLVPVTIENPTGIASFRFRIAYDTEVLSFVSAEKGNAMTGGTLTAAYQQDAKELAITWFHLENISGDGVLFYLVFEIAEGSGGVCPLVVSYLPEDIVNASWNQVDATVTNGAVRMGSTISGSITSYGSASDEITIRLMQDGEEVQTVTTKDGTYLLQSVAEGTYQILVSKKNHATRTYTVTMGGEDVTLPMKLHLIGDVNGDGKVNMKDWNRLYEHLNEVSLLTDYDRQCGDVNGDGKVNMKDWNRLYEHLSEVNPLW